MKWWTHTLLHVQIYKYRRTIIIITIIIVIIIVINPPLGLR